MGGEKGDGSKTLNRAERRKAGVKTPPPKMKHLPEKEYKEALDQAYRLGWDNAFVKACDLAVFYMFGIPILVLQEKFNEIRLKEFNGVPRTEHFFDLCADMFEEYNLDENTLTKLLNDVKDKTGFDISKRVFEEREDKT